ncbi:MAG: hypothetical protein AAFU03_14535, partial [Bacteroidota bacterium]
MYCSRRLLHLFAYWLLALPCLKAQIIIESSVVTDYIGTTYREVLYETNLNIDNQLVDLLNAIGTDQTWDFSTLNYVDSTFFIESLSAIDPDDPILDNPNFNGADLVWFTIFPPVEGGMPDTTFQYRYGSLNNGQWLIYGSITVADIDSDGMRDSLLQWLTPGSLQVPFPVSFNDEWADSTNLTQDFMGMEFVSSVMLDSNTVAGWGTLITPAGTFDALRVHNKHIDRVPNTPIVEVGNSVDFVTVDNQIGASIVVEDGRAFHAIRTLVDFPSSVYDPPVFDFYLGATYPNPTRGIAQIPFSLGQAQTVSIRLLQ